MLETHCSLSGHGRYNASEVFIPFQDLGEEVKTLGKQKVNGFLHFISSPLKPAEEQSDEPQRQDSSFPIAFQDDPGLVSYVRQRVHPPFPANVSYNLKHPEKLHFSQYN